MFQNSFPKKKKFKEKIVIFNMLQMAVVHR